MGEDRKEERMVGRGKAEERDSLTPLQLQKAPTLPRHSLKHRFLGPTPEFLTQ